jgi:hypothetical protein
MRGEPPIGEFIGDILDDDLRRSALRRLFRQIGQRLDIKYRTHDREEQAIEPDRLVHADALQE